MAIFGQAQQRLINVNHNIGGNTPRLFIVHIMQGTLDGTDSWFRNPAAQASSHFGTSRGGRLFQWVDTKDIAWHAVDANDHSIGIENAGWSGEKLTDAQVDNIARVYAWAHKKHPAIRLWLNRRTTGSGLSWHGLGGAAWGGHTACPGDPIVKQLPAILAKAKEYANS